MFSKVFIAIAFASTAFATVFVTSPVETTTFPAGQQATISWQDDGNAPTLAQFGPSKISVYVGNSQQQTSLQLINGNTDVSQSSSITFTPDASIGPNSNEYFIRFESLSLKDAAQPQFPALAFSHKFSLSGMTGVFTADINSQIAGQSTAPILGSTPTGTGSSSSSASSTPANSTPTSGSSTSKKATSTASGTPTASHSSSAMDVHAGWAGVLLSALVGITMF